MLDELLGKLKSETGSRITSETHLPAGKMDSVFSVIGDVLKREATGQIMGGKISNLMNLFSDKTNTDDANQLHSKLKSGVVNELSSRLGLAPEMSGNVAGIVLPALINMITRKNSITPEDDPSPLHELFGGDATTGIGNSAKDMLKGFMK